MTRPPDKRCWHCNRKRKTTWREWMEGQARLAAYLCAACWLDVQRGGAR